MRKTSFVLAVAAVSSGLLATTNLFAGPSETYQFLDPIEISAGGVPIRTESPGYASPAMVDLDGDGLEDLIVGQFKGGKMLFCKNTGASGTPAFAESAWIETSGQPATVPGVW